jgi:hypothetical protein
MNRIIHTENDIAILINNLEKDGVKNETESLMENLYKQTQAVIDQLEFSEDLISPLRKQIEKLVHRIQ